MTEKSNHPITDVLDDKYGIINEDYDDACTAFCAMRDLARKLEVNLTIATLLLLSWSLRNDLTKREDPKFEDIAKNTDGYLLHVGRWRDEQSKEKS